MKVLVLGGTKFIGPCLVEQLVAWGHEVAVFHRGQTHASLPAAVRHLPGDRHHLAEHAAELRRFAPDVVVDMIALIEEDARSLLSTFRGIAGRLVVLSSGDVYRAYGVFAGLEQAPLEPVPLTEDAPLRQALFIARTQAKSPADPMYHYEKIQVEQVVLSDPALPGTVLRLPMVYGPGDYQHRLHPHLGRMDAGRRVIPLDEGLARWRCLRGYVEDVAAAIALAATEAKAAGRIYNIAEEIAYTEGEWVARIAKAAGWGGRVVTVSKGRLPVPFNTDQDLTMDTSRIRAELGYREVVHPEEALRKAVAWERANPFQQHVNYTAEDNLLAELGL
jgi:nucleoside-diphosphate-sugar epimerase